MRPCGCAITAANSATCPGRKIAQVPPAKGSCSQECTAATSSAPRAAGRRRSMSATTMRAASARGNRSRKRALRALHQTVRLVTCLGSRPSRFASTDPASPSVQNAGLRPSLSQNGRRGTRWNWVIGFAPSVWMALHCAAGGSGSIATCRSTGNGMEQTTARARCREPSPQRTVTPSASCSSAVTRRPSSRSPRSFFDIAIGRFWLPPRNAPTKRSPADAPRRLMDCQWSTKASCSTETSCADSVP